MLRLKEDMRRWKWRMATRPSNAKGTVSQICLNLSHIFLRNQIQIPTPRSLRSFRLSYPLPVSHNISISQKKRISIAWIRRKIKTCLILKEQFHESFELCCFQHLIRQNSCYKSNSQRRLHFFTIQERDHLTLINILCLSFISGLI